jgi:hypothetical protein
MASRYAAAHARREQRRAGATGRQYLPLAEEAAPQEGEMSGRIGPMLGRGPAPAAASRLPAIDYSYLRSDLMRTAILTACLFGGMIILSFFIHV